MGVLQQPQIRKCQAAEMPAGKARKSKAHRNEYHTVKQAKYEIFYGKHTASGLGAFISKSLLNLTVFRRKT